MVGVREFNRVMVEFLLNEIMIMLMEGACVAGNQLKRLSRRHVRHQQQRGQSVNS